MSKRKMLAFEDYFAGNKNSARLIFRRLNLFDIFFIKSIKRLFLNIFQKPGKQGVDDEKTLDCLTLFYYFDVIFDPCDGKR